MYKKQAKLRSRSIYVAYILITLKIVKALLSAIAHLHSSLVCHKDIKPENIIVKTNDNGDLESIKLVDFNISQKALNDTFTMISQFGTPMFKAPEMIKNQQYNQKVDLWGAGCILCYLMHQKVPHNGQDFDDNSPYQADGLT